MAERALLVLPRFAALREPASRVAALARSAAALSAAETQDEAPPAAPDSEASGEFRELAESAGATVVGVLEQRRSRPDPATLLGRGKVQEIATVAASASATLVLVDHDLSPTQLRNLEDALPVPVFDRTQLILDIFARRARTREGQLQVELAQLEYMLPRLAGRGRAMSQLGGGIGTRGPGETQLETDRRRIGHRLVVLRRELERVRRVRGQQRRRRESLPVPTVALVGYTNAGKSTLFNTLTGAGVLASSRMFATLDPKLRALELPSRRRVLLSDTVGFIRNLPHTLVTSFRATLEEVQKAEVLVHVEDAADPLLEEHRLEVEKVLGELDALAKPRIRVMNKADLLAAEERAQPATGGFLRISALRSEGIDTLLAAVDDALRADPVAEAELWVPQARGDILAEVEASACVLERAYEERAGTEGVRLRIAAPQSFLGRQRRFAENRLAEGEAGPESASGPENG